MTAPGVDVVQEASTRHTEDRPDKKAETPTRYPRRKGVLLSLAGGFGFLAALLYPFFIVETRGTAAVDFTFWHLMALGACILGALGAFTLTVSPWRFAPIFPLLLALPVVPLVLAAVLGQGTSRSAAVGAGLGALIAGGAAVVTVLAALRAMPRLWRG